MVPTSRMADVVPDVCICSTESTICKSALPFNKLGLHLLRNGLVYKPAMQIQRSDSFDAAEEPKKKKKDCQTLSRSTSGVARA